MKQFNICAHSNHCYLGENADKLRSVMRARKYMSGGWITADQVKNGKGKYIWQGLRLDTGAIPVTITKTGHDGNQIETRLYNLDQTNFASCYPGVYTLLTEGASTQDAIQQILQQPVRGTMLSRAMQTGQSSPKGFWRRIASVL